MNKNEKEMIVESNKLVRELVNSENGEEKFDQLLKDVIRSTSETVARMFPEEAEKDPKSIGEFSKALTFSYFETLTKI